MLLYGIGRVGKTGRHYPRIRVTSFLSSRIHDQSHGYFRKGLHILAHAYITRNVPHKWVGLFTVWAALLLTAASLLAQDNATEEHYTTYRFDNGQWFDGQKFVPRTMFAVNGVFQSAYSGTPDTIVDLRHGYALPPFADAHNHTVSDAQPWQQQVTDYLYKGIFYLKNPNCTHQWTVPIREKVNSPHSLDVSYSYGGLTASGGHPVQIYAYLASNGQIAGMTAENAEGEAYYIINSESDLEKKWPDILAKKPDFIKVYLEHSEEYEQRRGDSTYYGKRGLDPQLIAPIVARAHAAGLRVSAHVNGAHDFHVAVVGGVDEINHLPLAPISPADAEEAARRGTVVVTTTVSHRPVEGVTDIDALHRGNLRLLAEAGVTIALGTDNNEHTVVDEAINVERLGVFERAELLHLWTEATVKTIFPGRKVGRLEDGYEASFVAVAENPLEDFQAVRSIRFRFKQGHVLTVTAPAAANNQPNITNALDPIYAHYGMDSTVAAYRHLRTDPAFAHNLNEFQLNEFGYALFNHGRTEDAIRIFRLNLEYFPMSANTWDSIAEVMLKTDRHAEAMEAYRQLLKILPECKQYRPEFLSRLEKTARSALSAQHSEG